MELLRFATVDFNPPLKSDIKDVFVSNNFTIQIETINTTEGKIHLLTVYTFLSECLKTDQLNRIILPDNEVKMMEKMIEFVCNAISVGYRTKRQINSIYPHLAFRYNSQEEKEWLEATSGIISMPAAFPHTEPRPGFDLSVLQSLTDRLDGVALLSETLSSTHATGRYREMIRLFESAFSLPASQLDKKLSQFLLGADMGYTRGEIKGWLKLRDAASHGDGKVSQYLVLESDVIKYIPRIEQAAYDVLFNKKEWRSNSKDRRIGWNPSTATLEQNGLRVTRGADVEITFYVFDHMCRYVSNLNISLIDILPPDCWYKWADIYLTPSE